MKNKGETMKFVHIADMHFDTPFTLLSSRRELGEARRIDQRQVFKKIINYIKENRIPYLFIAGDLYEQESIRQSTIEYQEITTHTYQTHTTINLYGMKT